MGIQIFEHRAAVLALSCAALLVDPACEHRNRNYCAGQPRNECPDVDRDASVDAPRDAASVCSDAQCPAPGVCLSDDICANIADVAYVQSGGSGTTCTRQAPCARLAHGIATRRSYVKVSGTVLELSPLPVNIDHNVIILGDTDDTADPLDPAEVRPDLGAAANGLISIDDGARVEIHRLGLGHTKTSNMVFDPFSAIEVAGVGAQVTLVGVTIHDNEDAGIAVPGGANGSLLTVIDSVMQHNGVAIWSQGGDLPQRTITVHRSKLDQNVGVGVYVDTDPLSLIISQSWVTHNTGGGIAISKGSFQIVGNIITDNRESAGSACGGICISFMADPGGRIDFNTLSRNQGDTMASGIECGRTVALRGNILFHNGSPPYDDVVGSCTMVDNRTSADPDPLFTSDFHLQPQSPARDAVASGWAVDGLSELDIDGQPRRSPADQGADEVQ